MAKQSKKNPEMPAPEVRCSCSEVVPTGKLKPNPENPNKHQKAQLETYAKIIRHQGWRKPVVVSKRSGLIVTGHGAWLTAKAQGWGNVPVDYQEFATAADEWAHVVADNRLPQIADMAEAE